MLSRGTSAAAAQLTAEPIPFIGQVAVTVRVQTQGGLMPDDILEQVLRSADLPTLPKVAVEVIDLVQRPNVDVDALAELIQSDPALAGRILKTANSSLYGQSEGVSTLSRAMVVLGLNRVKLLALGFRLADSLKDLGGNSLDQTEFWKRSFYAGAAAKQIAAARDVCDPEEAFLAGLFQDLGVLALSQVLGDHYQHLLDQSGGDHQVLIDLEWQNLSTTHTEVGAQLAEAWQLPPGLTTPVRYHEQPERAPTADTSRAQCIALAAFIAETFTDEQPDHALTQLKHSAHRWFAMSGAEIDSLLHGIHDDTKQMSQLFGVPLGPLGSANEILTRANHLLTELALQSEDKANQAERQYEDLYEEAHHDALTGFALRNRMEVFLADEFARAQTEAKPLSLIFIDIDHFKHLNDTYGHIAGDGWLCECATVLNEQLPEHALMTRYGGEEFVAILPGHDRPEAVKLAEQCRSAVDQEQFWSPDGEPLTLTVSCGVASCDDTFKAPSQLLQKSDEAQYAAKQAGRNCVRVHTVRPNGAAVSAYKNA